MKLKEDLKVSQELNQKLDALAKDREEKLAVDKDLVIDLKAKLDDADSRRVVAEVRVGKLEIEVDAAWYVVTCSIIEYKIFEEFMEEVAECCIDALH